MVDATSAPLRNKRILFLHGSLELGGAERQALQLADYLMRNYNCQIEFWGLSGPGRAAELCEQAGIPWQVVAHPFQGSKLEKLRRLVSLALKLRRARFDILMPYTFMPNLLCGLTWRFTGARVCIWNQRDSGIDSHVPPILLRIALRFTPWYLAISEVAARYLTGQLNIQRERMRIVLHGVRLAAPKAQPEEWRARLGLTPETFIAAMIANLSAWKNHTALLAAWHLALPQLRANGCPAVLLLVGRDDGQRAALETQVAALGLSDSVRFVGPIDDVPGLLREVDLMVHTCLVEGLPNAILEGMATGLPVLALDAAGNGEALRSSSPGLVQPNDLAGLAEKIVLLSRNPALRAQWGQHNRQLIEAHHQPDVVYARVAAILNAILQNQAPPP